MTRESLGSVVEVLTRLQDSGLAEDMTSSPHHWFVQTDFGALLGPMPDDALAEMARTGALIARDRVREGADGEWRLASEVPGLFDEQTPSFGLLSSTLEDLFAPEPSVQETIPPPTPKISPQTEPESVLDQIPPVEPPNIREPESILPAPSEWQARVTPTPRWQPTATRSHHGQKFDKQTWLVCAIAAAILIVLVGAWWLWPRQRPDIYKNYVVIYQELQQRRDIAEDHATWTEFVTRPKTQLTETVPWLEDRAKPGDREKTLLLYAGRDLQELLELPRTSQSPHLKRLDAFFEQLQEMYGSK